MGLNRKSKDDISFEQEVINRMTKLMIDKQTTKSSAPIKISQGTATMTTSAITKGSLLWGSSLSSSKWHIIQDELKDSAHTDKGVCQVSYDKGYEEGLKAGREGL